MATPARTSPWQIGFLILAIAVVLWVGYGLVVPRLFMDWQKSSQFGDMFGGIGALFSGLALSGVVVAILMQKEELELQRDELRRSVAAQTSSSESLGKQIDVMQLSAQLNALSALLAFYASNGGNQFPNPKTPGYLKPARDLSWMTLSEINDILARLRTLTGQH